MAAVGGRREATDRSRIRALAGLDGRIDLGVRIQHRLRLPAQHLAMRSRIHLRPAVAFDLALAAAFGLMALGTLLTTGRPHAALTTVHTVASRMGWRESYETGLVVGLGAAVMVAIAVVGLAVLVRRRG